MITLTAKIYIEDFTFEINRNNALSISTSIADRSDFKLPSFGIISNVGNLKFIDTTGAILRYANDGDLVKGLKCEMFINETLTDNKQKIGTFETDQWDYDSENKVVSVSLKDDLEEWQDIAVSEILYDPRNTTAKPFSWLYNHLWDIVKQNYDMIEFGDLDEETRDVLENTYIQYPMLKAGSLWQQWTKLCQVCQLHIYKNSDGVIVCRYNGGN